MPKRKTFIIAVTYKKFIELNATSKLDAFRIAEKSGFLSNLGAELVNWHTYEEKK